MRPATPAAARTLHAALAWYFVIVWGVGFLASKIGIRESGPYTFLAIRFALGVVLVAPIVLLSRPAWPRPGRELGHVVIAGLIMHAVHLGGSHYAQYLGLSAGVTALVLAAQPLLTALVAAPLLGERVSARQWVGVLLGLAGVALVVWHKIDIREVSAGGVVAVLTGLAGVTVGTLYQRIHIPAVDLRAASLIQFAACFAVLAPLAWLVEGLPMHWGGALLGAALFQVIASSILAFNAVHYLMRHGEATRVTSLMFLTPVVAVIAEFLLFDVTPGAVTTAGMALACSGVALATLRRGGAERRA